MIFTHVNVTKSMKKGIKASKYMSKSTADEKTVKVTLTEAQLEYVVNKLGSLPSDFSVGFSAYEAFADVSDDLAELRAIEQRKAELAAAMDKARAETNRLVAREGEILAGLS